MSKPPTETAAALWVYMRVMMLSRHRDADRLSQPIALGAGGSSSACASRGGQLMSVLDGRGRADGVRLCDVNGPVDADLLGEPPPVLDIDRYGACT